MIALGAKKQFTVHERCKCLSQVKGATKDVVRASRKPIHYVHRGELWLNVEVQACAKGV